VQASRAPLRTLDSEMGRLTLECQMLHAETPRHPSAGQPPQRRIVESERVRLSSMYLPPTLATADGGHVLEPTRRQRVVSRRLIAGVGAVCLLLVSVRTRASTAADVVGPPAPDPPPCRTAHFATEFLPNPGGFRGLDSDYPETIACVLHLHPTLPDERAG
jgi:hypothetical protein